MWRGRGISCDQGMNLPMRPPIIKEILIVFIVLWTFISSIFFSEFYLSSIFLKYFNDFKKNSLIQETAREARIVSAPAALLCPNDTRGKDPWSFSPRGSPFSFKTRKKRSAIRNARNHRRTQKTTQRSDKRRKSIYEKFK